MDDKLHNFINSSELDIHLISRSRRTQIDINVDMDRHASISHWFENL